MLPRLTAEQQMHAIEAASMPHLKADARDQIIRRISREIKGEQAKPKGIVDALIEAGIPVKLTPKAE